MSASTGLRERKKQRTRQLLTDTARRLFAERGFEQVSVAEIAREAEVSEATVFNYFPTKEDLVYSAFEAFEDQLLAAIRSRPQGQSVLEAFGEFILQPRGFLAEPDEAVGEQMAALTRTIAASPALQAREQQVLARYTDALASLIAEETSAPPGDLRSYAAASALIGVHRALINYVRQCVESGLPDRRRLARDIRSRGRVALDLLADGLGEYARKR
ncbi:MAG: TetR family transcriptional regulator [Solirubrobacteraceae bacterium]